MGLEWVISCHVMLCYATARHGIGIHRPLCDDDFFFSTSPRRLVTPIGPHHRMARQSHLHIAWTSKYSGIVCGMPTGLRACEGAHRTPWIGVALGNERETRRGIGCVGEFVLGNSNHHHMRVENI